MNRRMFLKFAIVTTAFTAIFSKLPGINILKKDVKRSTALTGLKKASFFKKL